MSKKGRRGGASSGGETRLDPRIIYFSHSKIRSVFSTGKSLDETLAELEAGSITVDDIPRIQVIFDGERYVSMNNRRLWVFKELAKKGVIETVPCDVQSAKSGSQQKIATNTLSLEGKRVLK